eukprot:3198392-Pleurochrysis_carterae.AAC.1
MKKHDKTADPKRVDATRVYDESFGKCRHCGGAHWHRDCPKRKRDPAPGKNAKAAKNTGSAALAAAAAPDDASDAAVGDALFSDGNGAVTFTCNDAGAALCVRGTPATVAGMHHTTCAYPAPDTLHAAECDPSSQE